MSKQRYVYASFNEFYQFYFSEHANPICRGFHYVGTGLSMLATLAAIFIHPKWIIAAPFLGYGFAWIAHFFIEKNRPATFSYPLWSFFGDYKMLFSFLTGRICNQLKRACVQ